MIEREKSMAVKEKILVVDDEPSIRKYLQTLLEVDGFDVETVSSGRDALARVNKGERPDFIILDVLMPEMNGLDTLKELMQVDRSLNVIMLSCSNEVGTVVEAIRIGAHDYLTKPFEKTELDAAMLKSRQKKQLTTENQALRDYCDQVTEDLSFLAASPQMVRIRQQILKNPPRPEGGKPAVCEGELRCVARRTSGIGAFRIRAGRVHGRGAQQTRKV